MDRCSAHGHITNWEEVLHLPDEWQLYKDLIAGIPADVGVKDFVMGRHWVLVEAESGCGMAMCTSGGSGTYGLDSTLSSLSLRDVACQVISWNFLEASVGVAALNAWYSTPQHAREAGMKIEVKGSNDGFELYRNICAGKKVAVVGHFPLVERLSDECELTVLERHPSGIDVPDSSCEYIIPHQDFTFITGTTLTNKTLVRLLCLVGKSQGSCIMVGPSVVGAPLLFDYGVDCMAGSIVDDIERARAAILCGSSSGIFGHGVTKMRIERVGWPEKRRESTGGSAS